MSEIIKLPSGATVTIKDVSTLRVKDRNRVIKAGDGLSGDITKGIAFSEALISTIVEDWSFDLIIPSVKPESLEELEIADYDALVTASEKVSSILFPTLAKTDKNEADPKATIDDSKD
jgi:hypothetical protein